MYSPEDSKMRIGVREGCWFRRRDETICILILVLLSLGRTLEAAPVESSGKSTRLRETLASGLPSKKSQSEEVGNPSELAWQAWLLVDSNSNSQNSGALDSATLLRRITPKSIFIAPALTACAEGYQADTMNRCVKDVSIDSQAHRGFLVERLNAIFGKPQSSSSALGSSSSASSSLPNGPLQLNIPLFMPGASKPIEDVPKVEPEVTQENKDETALSGVKNSKVTQEDYFNREKLSHDAILTVYELDDASKENESTFSLGNKSTDTIDQQSKITSTKFHDDKAAVPVDEFIPDSKGNYGSIVDYKVPADDNIFHSNNRTESSDDDIEDVSKDEQRVSPTLVLLLSPTKLPATPMTGNSDLIVAHNSSSGQVIIQMGNVNENNATGKEIIRVSVPENLGQSSVSSATIIPEDEENTTTNPKVSDIVSGETKVQSPTIDESYDQLPEDESTEIYDDENDENYEESTEFDDEILKHSEAGIGVTLMSPNERTSPKPSTMKFQSVLNSRDKEETGSSEISSEVSINPDFVRETTLVDMNSSKMQNVSASTISTLSTSKNNEETFTTVVPEVSKELEVPETGIVSMDDLRNEKRDGHLSKVREFIRNLEETKKNDEQASIINDREQENKNLEVAAIENQSSEIDSTTINNLDGTSSSNSTPNGTSSSASTGNENTKVDAAASKDVDAEVPEVVYPVRGIEEAFEDLQPSDLSATEKVDSSETMIAASTNVDGTIISREKPKFSMREKLQNRPFRFSDETATRIHPKVIPTTPRIEAIYDYDIPIRNYQSNRQNPHGIRQNDALPIIRTIEEEEVYQPSVKYDLPFSGNLDQNFPMSNQNGDYIKFPNNEARPENRVRFPTEEANSITSDYKERNRRPYVNHDEQTYNRGHENTRVNHLPDAHGKESYWWLPNEWREDRQQADIFPPQRSRPSPDQRSKDRAPMSLRFWTRMPLVRDPSMLYPTRPVDSSNDSKSSLPLRGQSRRVSYFREMSNHEMSRAFARNKPSIIG